MPKVTILRGLPGSGKSYSLRHPVPPDFVVVSADDYFVDDDDGVYRFDPALLPEAHAACFRSYLDELAAPLEQSDVVVDNTNSTNAEMAPYILAAQAYRYDVEIVHFYTRDIEACRARNQHGVPASAILAMAARWEQPLPFYPTEKVVCAWELG